MAQVYRIYISVPSHLSEEQLEIKKSIMGAIRKEGFEPQEFLTSGIPKTMAWSFENAERGNVTMPRSRHFGIRAMVSCSSERGACGWELLSTFGVQSFRGCIGFCKAAARSCACGIFLFTKDDPLEGIDGAAPRDNVIFEAGFFLRANGRDRVAVIREEGAKMPADLGGNVYISLKDRGDIAPIHSQIRRFLENAL